MKNYELSYGGECVQLPAYNFKIAEKLEKQEAMNLGSSKFRDKCKSMYDIEKELLGDDFVDTMIGKFEDADPNEINIVYMMIVRAYSNPLDEFNNSNLSDKLDSTKIDKMVELINALDKANNLKIKK